ncbi:hypothetical protein ABC347_00800 [Sphingomonas sp. 1P06PA]|uniref:hypothetical protein n=1 Tax=Sphingomonas sp. 1P06PA TaxID=554121 RepID=UPI0039A4A3DE
MTANTGARPPRWFWIVAIVLLMWEAMGCAAYLSQVTMDAADLAKLPRAQAEIWMAMPDWAKGAYAIAVWIGLAGGIALVMRRRLALVAFLVSLAAVLVQFGWVFAATPILTTVGPSAALFPLFIITIGIVSVWFARTAVARGWLR